MGEADSKAGQLLVTHLLYTVQDPFCAARQSSFQTVFTLFSLFLGGLSLGLPDQLYTVQDPFSTARKSSFQNSFQTLHSFLSTLFSPLFYLFFGGPSLSITDQGCGGDFMGEAHSIAGQPLLTHLLYTVQDPFCAARQFSFQTVFTLFSLFLGGLSLGLPDQG